MLEFDFLHSIIGVAFVICVWASRWYLLLLCTLWVWFCSPAGQAWQSVIWISFSIELWAMKTLNPFSIWLLPALVASYIKVTLDNEIVLSGVQLQDLLRNLNDNDQVVKPSNLFAWVAHITLVEVTWYLWVWVTWCFQNQLSWRR